MWLGPRLVLPHRRVPVRLSFGLSRCLLFWLFLIPGLSAVGDLRQDFPNSFNILVSPNTETPSADSLNGRSWDLSGSDIALNCHQTQPQLCCYFASRILKHSVITYNILLMQESRSDSNMYRKGEGYRCHCLYRQGCIKYRERPPFLQVPKNAGSADLNQTVPVAS